MYNANLYRADQGLQAEVEVGVLSPKDERYLKAKAIQVDIIDMTYLIKLVAKLPDSRTIELDKGTLTMEQAFAKLVEKCKFTIENIAKVVH